MIINVVYSLNIILFQVYGFTGGILNANYVTIL